MELTNKIRNEIKIHREDVKRVKGADLWGYVIILEWVDENGDKWATPILPDYKKRNDPNWKLKLEEQMQLLLHIIPK